MTEGEKSQEMKHKGGRTISLKLSRYSSSLQHAAIRIDRTLLAVAVVEDAREERRDVSFVYRVCIQLYTPD